MNISAKIQDGSSPFEKYFQIHISPEEVNKGFNKAYNKMQGRVNIKGFRKGKNSQATPQKPIWY